ncbi:MAG: uroporphyrinogen decarboxylase family protein, partial [Candidatus Thermoplasmatota archaeon]|nr:uroporphyrinogen decarboxylase family protein [Candidatus Thermoplasmatota archaeon]
EYGGGIRITPFAFDDVEAWPEFEARTHAPWAANALAALPEVLPRDVARLGFAGCPWTVGMYLIAGGTGDKEFVNTRAKVHADPEAAMHLFLRLGDIVGNLLADQVVHGGADAVQLFDTWAGLLDEATYRRFAMPATARAIDVFRAKCPTRTPLIHYAKASGHLHGAIMELDIDGLSLDWRDDLRAYRASHGKRLALQGNLDPTFMHGSTEAAVSAAEAVLEAAGDAPGYIFNLGHGFAPSARIECVEAVLRTVEGR